MNGYVTSMDLDVIAVGVFLGNVMFASVSWGLWQFHKHDYEAPWLAYSAVLIPLAFIGLVLVSTGSLPPQLDALAPQ